MDFPVKSAFQTAEADDTAIDLWSWIDFLRRRWQVILGTAGICVLLALVLLFSLTPEYTGTAQVLLDPQKSNVPGADTLISELTLDSASVESQIALITSASLLRRVVEQEKLVDDPEFGTPKTSPSWFGFLFSWLHKSAADLPEQADDIPPNVLHAVRTLQSALEVSRQTTTYVLNVAVSSERPKMAAKLANAVADAYLVDQLEARYDAAKRESTWLTDRLKDLQEQLRESEEAVENFRTAHNLVTTGATTMNEQQLSELNARLVAVRADAAERQAKYEQAEKLVQSGGNLDSIPDVVQSPVIASLREREADVSGREADLIAKYGPRHPLIVNVRAEHDDIERQISQEVQRIIGNLKNDYDVVHSRELSLQQSLQQLTGDTGVENQNEIRLRELERIADANKSLYEQFLSRAKVTEQEKSFDSQDSRIISPATLPQAASYPKRKLGVAIAMAFGLALGIGGGILLDLLNSGFTSRKQLEEQLDLPVLAMISKVDEEEVPLHRDVRNPAFLCLSKPLSRYSEAVRGLRTGIEMADIDNPPKVVLITSAVPNEGKSTLAASIAFSAARTGRVLLVDCDLRRPGSVSKSFGISKLPGVVDLLARSANLQSAIHKDQASGIHIMGAGTTLPQSPPDLLGSDRMEELVTTLREVYSLIVIDAPPMAPVVDAKILGRIADKILMVVRWGETPRELVAECVGQLNTHRKVAGVALNLVDERQASRYGRYAYYGQRYYGQYYTE